MKFLIPFTSFLILSCNSNQQSSENDNNQSTTDKKVDGARPDKDGNCFQNTSELNQAPEINIDVYYPCTWIEVHENDNEPTLVLQVGTMPEGITANIGLTVTITKLKDTLTSEKLEKLRAELYSKGKPEVMEGTIFKDTIDINNVKGGVITTKNIMPSGQTVYKFMAQLYFKNSLIQLIYAVGAPTETEALSAFEERKTLFIELAKRTKFYAKSK